MTILNRDLNEEYERVERAASMGYKPHARVVAIIGDTVDSLIKQMRDNGTPICNCDGARSLELQIYELFRDKNPIHAVGYYMKEDFVNA